jgi:hypothetical protein
VKMRVEDRRQYPPPPAGQRNAVRRRRCLTADGPPGRRDSGSDTGWAGSAGTGAVLLLAGAARSPVAAHTARRAGVARPLPAVPVAFHCAGSTGSGYQPRAACRPGGTGGEPMGHVRTPTHRMRQEAVQVGGAIRGSARIKRPTGTSRHSDRSTAQCRSHRQFRTDSGNLPTDTGGPDTLRYT